MLDPDTFVTMLYVAADEFCKRDPLARAALPRRPGPRAALTPSEVLTLSVFAQWARFPSERAFYRYAAHTLRAAFPTLPTRAQFNRLTRAQEPVLRAFFTALVRQLRPAAARFEVLDTTAVASRNIRRHGAGWLPGVADLAKSTRLGWYEGFHLLTASTPEGVLTGFGFGPASAKEALLADTFLTARAQALAVAHAAGLAVGWTQDPTAPDTSVQYYLGDGAFESTARQQRWAATCAAVVVAPPRRSAHGSWPPARRRWAATLRQVVESVHAKLHLSFRLSLDRPHALAGFRARLAAMAVLHDFCIWVNRQLGRPDLAFADLIDW